MRNDVIGFRTIKMTLLQVLLGRAIFVLPFGLYIFNPITQMVLIYMLGLLRRLSILSIASSSIVVRYIILTTMHRT